MAQTSVGFAGTVNDAEWAVLSSFLGNQACVSSQASLAVTPVSGARSVSVAAGVGYGDGVQTTLSAPETVALATPTNGQWYLIVLRRVWTTKATSLVAIPHSTTSTALPTSAPTSYPAAMLVAPGTQADQPLAWAWCNSANTTVVVSDLRQQPIRTIIQQPNLIINGGFDIWQRGTSGTVGGPIGYIGDRWQSVTYAGGTAYWFQQPASGNPAGTRYCARVQRASGATNAATLNMTYAFETVDVLKFAGKTVTLSWYARAGANYSPAGGAFNYAATWGTGTDQSVFGTGITGGADIVRTSVALSTSWQRYTATFTVPENSTSFGISFYSGTMVGTAGAADYYEITAVQMELGSWATPFRRHAPSMQGELAACQRYYYRWTSLNNDEPVMATGIQVNSNTARIYVTMPVEMRVKPISASAQNMHLSDQVTNTGALSSFILTGRDNTKTCQFLISAAAVSFPTKIPTVLTTLVTGGYVEINAEL